jgi:hypothetical protein
MNRVQNISWAIAMLAAADPAFAGVTPVGVPAPAIGVGIGAVALIGIGYRAFKRRLNP